ncbi:MAG: peptide-methionine (S)-S-oxide reductase MsrA [Candidatus Dojkabacteria bacterium]
METATFASGCFWCTEEIFENVRGVGPVISGYAGGTKENPTYEDVSFGETGHAEATQFEFDPSVITYKELVEIFLKTHNPTTLNQQGNDVGPQYRSVIFYHNDEQKKDAEEVIKEITDDKVFPDPIVTEVTPFTNFFEAEDYHQDYFKKNPTAGYCSIVIAPKLSKFRKELGEKYGKDSSK